MLRPAEALVDAHILLSTRSVANERVFQHAYLGIFTSYAHKQVSDYESSREQVILSKIWRSLANVILSLHTPLPFRSIAASSILCVQEAQECDI
jgi:hypothetical protein